MSVFTGTLSDMSHSEFFLV